MLLLLLRGCALLTHFEALSAAAPAANLSASLALRISSARLSLLVSAASRSTAFALRAQWDSPAAAVVASVAKAALSTVA